MRTIKFMDQQADNKVGDTATIWSFSLLDDGSLNYVDANSKLAGHLTQNNAFVLDVPITGDNGHAVLDFSQTDVAKLSAGEYGLEVQLTDDDGKVAKYPTVGSFPFRLELSATDLGEGSMIPVISLTEFQAQMSDAVHSAEDATDQADSAVSNANKAATSANSAANSANTAATNANKAANNANSAATVSSTQAANVNTAVTNATKATTAANSATTSANTAASNANTATSSANSAAKSASTAAVSANSAANNANSIAADAKKVVDDTAAGEALETAKSAQASVDGLEIGGRNLLRNTTDFSGWGKWQFPTITTTQSDGIYRYRATKSVGQQVGIASLPLTVFVKTGDMISIKFALNTTMQNGQLYLLNDANGKNNMLKAFAFQNDGKDHDYEFKLNVPTDSGKETVFGILDDGTSTAGQYMELISDTAIVTTGGVPTDWSPAPEDKANDAEVGHLAKDQTWAGVNNFNNLQINGQNIDAYIAAQIAKATGTA